MAAHRQTHPWEGTNGWLYPNPNVETEPEFHGYQIEIDSSWLEPGQTFNQANRRMQDSTSRTGYLPHIPCIFAHELVTEHARNRHGSTSARLSSERTCNSFLQYRNLAHGSCKGQQTDISKEVERLWRTESREMHFFCLRNSEIETCIHLIN
jgi:hypothetical protein